MVYDPSSSQAPTPSPARLLVPTCWHAPIVPLLLIISAALATSSLLGDSPTFDEPLHLASGVAMLKHGDFRMSADHPPLARIWCALPLMLMSDTSPGAEDEAWVDADIVAYGVKWMFEMNDPQRLIVPARLMMVLALIATCLTTYALARRVFGPDAGLLALLIAALSPTLLAHGRLVTTDLPIALFIALTLLTYSLLLERVTWPRLIAAGLAVGAAAVSKMSWPLVLPAMGIMLFAALVRSARNQAERERESHVAAESATVLKPRGGTREFEKSGKSRRDATTLPQPLPGREGGQSAIRPPLPGREGGQARTSPALLIVGSAALAGFVWLAIWSAYGWQRTLIAPLPAGASAEETARYERSLETINFQWHYALHDENDVSRTGLVASLCRAAVDYSLLPDGYVFGLARTLFFTGARTAYFLGDYSESGWRGYFPTVFLIKTPIAAIGLMFAGAAALWIARLRPRDVTLLAGMAAFIVIYGGYLIASNVNLGHRHLLPIYPLLYAIAGGAAAWCSVRLGRWLVAAAAVWLVAANAYIYPHYLSYFNELIGGPAHGHEYVVDSSIDWGQDLLRLRDFAAREKPVYLSYFGSADPQRYLDCQPLPSFITFAPTTPSLKPGVYVISATQLVGLYAEHIRKRFWGPRALETLRDFERAAVNSPPDNASPEALAARERAIAELPEWRAKLLISRLRDRKPDARIGWSMMAYRLSQADIDALTRP